MEQMSKRKHVENDEITQHYDQKKSGSIQQRSHSSIIGLRSFNNWIKAVLINEYVSKNDRVVDFCCGKGGDLRKWNIAQISYLIGADISSVSIQQCQARCNEMRTRFECDFYAVDCFSDEFLKKCLIEKNLLNSFDIVSCQFAYHYSFSSKETMLCALKNISSCLKKGGKFLATFPDAEVIFKLSTVTNRVNNLDGGVSFGNGIYKIKFENTTNFVKYGQKYWFYLKDAIDNCPEYLVHLETLEKYAKDVGLKMIYVGNFIKFYNEFKEKYSYLLRRMKVSNDKGNLELTDEELEVVSLYLSAVFEKQL